MTEVIRHNQFTVSKLNYSKPANQQKFAQQIQYIQQRVRVIKDDNNINKSKLGLR